MSYVVADVHPSGRFHLLSKLAEHKFEAASANIVLIGIHVKFAAHAPTTPAFRFGLSVRLHSFPDCATRQDAKARKVKSHGKGAGAEATKARKARKARCVHP